MLDTLKPTATVAVKDLAAAKKFYEKTLGLRLVGAAGEEALTFEAGGVELFVYRSSFAGTNHATGVTWTVPDGLESVVRELGERGVKFEHYDLPQLERKGDIHVGGGTQVAWFKDPDGNIHSLVSSS